MQFLIGKQLRYRIATRLICCFMFEHAETRVSSGNQSQKSGIGSFRAPSLFASN